MATSWFPGHMNKAMNALKEEVKKVDLTCEVLDARIPRSSANRLLEDLTREKPRLVLLNKKDMADPQLTQAWVQAFKARGIEALPVNAREEELASRITAMARSALKKEFARRKARGLANQEMRMLVFGIPNSGKSTLINKLAGRRGAQVGNKPGVTQSFQWIKASDSLLILDSPGIMMKRLNDEEALHLAYTGAIRDEVLEAQELGFQLIKDLQAYKPQALADRYGVDPEAETLVVMEAIARKQGALLRGGEIDYDRTGKLVLDDFRKLKLGRITLERPRGKKGAKNAGLDA